MHILEFCEKNNVGMRDLSEKAGVPLASLYRHANGESMPTKRHILNLSLATDGEINGPDQYAYYLQSSAIDN